MMEHVRLVHFRGDVEAERPHMMSEYLRMKSQSHNFLIQSNEINGLWQLPVSLHHLYGLHSPDLVSCHCTTCRKQAGAPYQTWAIFTTDDIRWHVNPTEGQVTNEATRTLCPQCSSTIKAFLA